MVAMLAVKRLQFRIAAGVIVDLIDGAPFVADICPELRMEDIYVRGRQAATLPWEIIGTARQRVFAHAAAVGVFENLPVWRHLRWAERKEMPKFMQQCERQVLGVGNIGNIRFKYPPARIVSGLLDGGEDSPGAVGHNLKLADHLPLGLGDQAREEFPRGPLSSEVLLILQEAVRDLAICRLDDLIPSDRVRHERHIQASARVNTGESAQRQILAIGLAQDRADLRRASSTLYLRRCRRCETRGGGVAAARDKARGRTTGEGRYDDKNGKEQAT